MSEQHRAKIFRSGNSVALRLPKGFGLKAGDEMILREGRGGFTAEIAMKVPPRINLDGIYGAIPDLHLPTRDPQLIEDDADLDWDGKQFKS